MRKPLIILLAALAITGCAMKNNQLQTNGYYSNGSKFFYCRNPSLFSPAFIDFANKNYFLSSDKKLLSVTGVHSPDGDDLKVSVPLNCRGKFNMAGGDVYNFDMVMTIPSENSPFVSKLNYSKTILSKDKKVTSPTGICLKGINGKSSGSCTGQTQNDDYYEQFPKSAEDFERNKKYMQTHQTYVCRTVRPSYADGFRIREFVVTDPNQCQ